LWKVHEVLEDFILSETMPAWIEKDSRKLKRAIKTPKFQAGNRLVKLRCEFAAFH